MLDRLPYSPSAFHREPEHAALGKVRIIIQPGDLEPLYRQHARGQRRVVLDSEALKGGYVYKVDSRHGLRSGVDRAQIHRLAKSEIVRMEEAAAAVRVRRIAEDLEKRALYIASEVVLI